MIWLRQNVFCNMQRFIKFITCNFLKGWNPGTSNKQAELIAQARKEMSAIIGTFNSKIIQKSCIFRSEVNTIFPPPKSISIFFRRVKRFGYILSSTRMVADSNKPSENSKTNQSTGFQFSMHCYLKLFNWWILPQDLCKYRIKCFAEK